MQLQQRLPNYIKEKSLKKRRRVFLAREQSLTRIANREKVKTNKKGNSLNKC